jgi:UDP-N-acetylglucosamine--N-acetylmuramyl-(pentapeptide) pyrophosphoryl-undecaprenol N-acetylglucosamine transferase
VKKEKKSKFWVVAAGTGGHIFPGLSVAKELEKQNPQLEAIFFGTRDRLEDKIIPKHGYPLIHLKAKQWKGRGILERIRSLWNVLKTTCFIWKLAKEQKPKFLLSVGGYVSVPVALGAIFRRVPYFILEPNIKAGIANKLLSRFAKKAFCAPASDALKLFSCPVLDTGNPVLGSFEVNPIRSEAKRILVLGGSQGARILCHVTLKLFSELKKRHSQCEMFLQSGEKNLEDSMEIFKSLNLDESCEIKPFIEDVSEKLIWADLVIARAGAMTLTELALTHMPAVLVPYPFAADDHQRVNAKILADAGAAYLMDEKDKDFELKLLELVEGALFSEDSHKIRLSLSQSMEGFSGPNAAQKIASEIFQTLC